MEENYWPDNRERKRNVVNEADLCRKLRARLGRARRDAAVFAIMTVILTPVFVGGAVIVLLLALTFVDVSYLNHLGYDLSFLSGVNLSIAFMVASYFLRPKAPYQRNKSDAMWVTVGLSLFGALLAFSYATPLARTHPGYFWPIYLFLALAILGCMGYAYEPRENYYLGWRIFPYYQDNPFTLEDDIDRAHFSLGFGVALPELIINSYASIFGSTWLWRGLDEPELLAAVDLLQSLAVDNPASTKPRVQTMGRASALRVVRALVKLEMIDIDEGRPRLLLEGRKFLGLKNWW